jgi:hypothetical protein
MTTDLLFYLGRNNSEVLAIETDRTGIWAEESFAGVTRVLLEIRSKAEVVASLDSEGSGMSAVFDWEADEHRLALSPGVVLDGLLPAGRYDGRLTVFGEFAGGSFPDGWVAADDLRISVK